MTDLYPYVKHVAAQCAGHACPFHSPSDHHMVDWPKLVRETGLTERICAHGVGHPDPDSLEWIRRVAGMHVALSFGVHGCCPTLCCVGKSGFVH